MLPAAGANGDWTVWPTKTFDTKALHVESIVGSVRVNVENGPMKVDVAGNLIAALTSNYSVLLVSRVIAGLAQGPFFGIGAVVAMKLVPDKLAGQAVGQMFAGLTLANVLGVPAGTWIGKARA